MELKILTIKEGMLRMLDGEEITLMTPVNLSNTFVDELKEAQDNGGFCVRTADLRPKEDPEPHPDNDGGLYTMQNDIVETVPEEPEKPKKAKVDTGKIKALADAGWSVQKIAGEMGLSGPTIRRYLKEGLGE